MNKSVKFELAKLLKEKEFDELVCTYYVPEIKESVYYQEYGGEKFNMNILHTASGKECFSAPTIAEVVIWLYEKHGIWIRITPIPYSDNLTHWRWEHISTNYATRNMSWKKEEDYLSPTKAYEAAIEYCLTKLI